MKNEKKYEVKLKDDKTVEFIEITTTTSTLDEAISISNNVVKKKMETENQLAGLTKAKEENQIDKDIEDLQTNVDQLHNLKKDFDNILQPHFDNLEIEVRQFVKTKKAEIGWSRMSDPNLKIVRTAETMAEIANKLNLDVAHPVIMKVKKDFETI